MKTTLHITPRYAETDQMGVIHHATYLLYMEDARTAFLDELGMPYASIENAGYLSPVVSVEVNYGTSLVYGRSVEVTAWLSRVTPVKLEYSYEFRQGGEDATSKPNATAKSVHCLVRKGDFKPVSMKRAVPELYEKYVQAVEPSEQPAQGA